MAKHCAEGGEGQANFEFSLTDQMALRQYLSVLFMILVVVNRLCVCVCVCVCVLDQPGESA